MNIKYRPRLVNELLLNKKEIIQEIIQEKTDNFFFNSKKNRYKFFINLFGLLFIVFILYMFYITAHYQKADNFDKYQHQYQHQYINNQYDLPYNFFQNVNI